jgi:predicted metal-dependent phosphoesterase TrpH
LTPFELVEQGARAGLTAMAVTEHDTVAAVEEVRLHAAARRIDAVPGIEVTAVEDGRDVHVLGYFLDPGHAPFNVFLAHQRANRVDRVRAIVERLAALGLAFDLDAPLRYAAAVNGRSIGRPQIARAMIRAGYVADVNAAFDQWLSPGRPAFVPRTGPSPEQVVDAIHRAGGLASLAHPGRTKIDDRIAALARAGLDAIEVYHSDHDADAVRRYRGLATALGLLATGGSDFHGDPGRGVAPGAATLPDEDWQRLRAERRRHAAT